MSDTKYRYIILVINQTLYFLFFRKSDTSSMPIVCEITPAQYLSLYCKQIHSLLTNYSSRSIESMLIRKLLYKKIIHFFANTDHFLAVKMSKQWDIVWEHWPDIREFITQSDAFWNSWIGLSCNCYYNTVYISCPLYTHVTPIL